MKNEKTPVVSLEEPAAICDSELCNSEWHSDMCGYQCDCGFYIWMKGDSEEQDGDDQ